VGKVRCPWLTIRGARHNNLKNLDVSIPLGRFVCVTGVSGSGKSSLVNDILYEQLAADLNGVTDARPGRHRAIEGREHLDKVIGIDQSPIGRTPRSNPATYIKVFDAIRDLYARLPDSRVRGYQPARFSFNVATGARGGGRCEACEGNGANRVEMDFLADVWVTCPVCGGRRFNQETLQIQFKGKNIHEVLEMDVQEALRHFESIPKIRAMLATLQEVGLDYLKLGQSSTTLSGGEAQRIKLARELVRRSTGRTLFILDEPTTGLHFDDVRRLLTVLHGFVDAGNTVVVIEHHLDVIRTADWVIDLGPEGGDAGGEVVVAGTPEDVEKCRHSHTGKALREAKAWRRMASAEEPGRASDPCTAASGTVPAAPAAAAGQGSGRKASAAEIVVLGARENNLRNLTVRVPRGRMTVCSGVSGSGKTSFAMDTVYTEGQRRYVESLSAYARQFLGQLQKPKVDHIYGLSPAIAIEQQAASKSPRSTVGTVTEIYDYMRVLWARVGRPYCPQCGVPVERQTSDEILDHIMSLPAGTRLLLCAPLECSSGDTWAAVFARCRAQGYARARVDGRVLELAAPPEIDSRQRHRVELVVDRIEVRAASRSRIGDSVEHCLALGRGVMWAVPAGDSGGENDSAETLPDHRPRHGARRFSQHRSCPECGTGFAELTPHHFSFNSRLGWCPACEGLGVQRGTTVDAIIARPQQSILGGAIVGWEEAAQRPLLRRLLIALARAIGFDPEAPCASLTPAQRHDLLFGLGDRWIDTATDAAGSERADEPRLRFQWKGFFPAIDEATRASWEYRYRLQDLAADVVCQTCRGGRLRPEAAAVRLDGGGIEKGANIVEVCRMPLAAAAAFFESLRLDRRQLRIAGELLHEIKSRLRFLLDVGLDYLSLDRSAPTLSGGESQRIRLASQIGSGLTGVLYVLDEPTVGLHPRDNQRLVKALHKLRDLGNTLLLVEHDREVIESADHLLDFGPGAGREGGDLVAAGPPRDIARQSRVSRVRRVGAAESTAGSLTGRYLAGVNAIPVPTNRRPVGLPRGEQAMDQAAGRDDPAETAFGARGPGDPPGLNPPRWLIIRGARQHNLRGIDVAFPLGRFICVTGVSGSGKSSLITETLQPALAARIHRARVVPGDHERLVGVEHIDKVINVDQQPIGNSPLSNAATYTGVFDLLRELFARLPESRVRGYTANRFSFNRPGGRCEACDGYGQVYYEMHFLPDVWVQCETCAGRRYNRETLEVRYKGLNIAEVLELPVGEALRHFANVPKVRRMLQALDDVGLGYLPLGQGAPTLSGGEAQRLKLAAELGRPNTGRTIYFLDEPTTGLHFEDLRKLLAVLHRLVDLGNTVICIEHNLEVIKTADYVIDLGPEAGEKGGAVVAVGTPEVLAQSAASHTGRLLRKTLAAGPHRERERFAADRMAAPQVVGSDPDLQAAGSVKMPWERDGRRWHTAQRAGRDGRPVRWEAAALEYVVERIERIGRNRLLPTDWADRARVEIKAKAPKGLPQTAVPWFCHILTGGEWLLDLLFRVPQGVFTSRRLEAELGLKRLEERGDIPAYGVNSRVLVRPAVGDLDQIRILVHDRKEVATAAFRGFLSRAWEAYCDHLGRLARDAAGAEPWKQDGKAWHLSQRSIPANQPKVWKPLTLAGFLGLVSRIAPGVRPVWGRKVFVELVDAAGRRVGKIITNQGAELRVDLHIPRGALTPTRVEGLGSRQQFARPGSSGAELTFWFTRLEELDQQQLRLAVEAAASSSSAVPSPP